MKKTALLIPLLALVVVSVQVFISDKSSGEVMQAQASLSMEELVQAQAGLEQSTSPVQASVQNGEQSSASAIRQSSAGQEMYFPSGAHVLLSEYYRLPGQQVSVMGRGFMPHESVTVNIFGSNQSVKAGADGSFSIPSIAIPFAAQDSTQPVSAQGGGSGVRRTAEIKVGTFYPHVEPRSYYVMPGEPIRFSGVRFAPGEPVEIRLNGEVVGLATADPAGSFSSQAVAVPAAAGSYRYAFTGKLAGKSVQVAITVASYVP